MKGSRKFEAQCERGKSSGFWNVKKPGTGARELMNTTDGRKMKLYSQQD